MERPVKFGFHLETPRGGPIPTWHPVPGWMRRRSKRLTRRLISLIFVDRACGLAVIIMIRRELPRTSDARLAKSLAHSDREDSPFRVPFDRRLFHPGAIINPRLLLQAAVLGLAAGFCRSTWVAIAQINPSISRATAVTTCCFGLPFATSRR